MIKFNKPRGDSISYVTAMSEKALYRVCKEHKLMRRRFILLLMCQEYVRSTNRLVTAKVLNRFAPYSVNALSNNLEYLLNRDYLVRIKGKRAKLDAEYKHARKFYILSDKGTNLVHYYNTLVGREMAKWRDNLPEWKLPSKPNQDYYKELGIMN